MIGWRELRTTGRLEADDGDSEIIWHEIRSLPEFYRRLGIEPGCTSLEVKQAYRKMARRCHPDCQPLSLRNEAEKHMAELNAAYEVLGDSRRRARYDAEHGLVTTL